MPLFKTRERILFEKTLPDKTLFEKTLKAGTVWGVLELAELDEKGKIKDLLLVVSDIDSKKATLKEGELPKGAVYVRATNEEELKNLSALIEHLNNISELSKRDITAKTKIEKLNSSNSKDKVEKIDDLKASIQTTAETKKVIVEKFSSDQQKYVKAMAKNHKADLVVLKEIVELLPKKFIEVVDKAMLNNDVQKEVVKLIQQKLEKEGCIVYHSNNSENWSGSGVDSSILKSNLTESHDQKHYLTIDTNPMGLAKEKQDEIFVEIAPFLKILNPALLPELVHTDHTPYQVDFALLGAE